MIILKPIPLKTIWGGEKLKDYINYDYNEKIGQLYTVSAETGLDNEIAYGDFKGKTLSYVWNNNRALFNYDKTETFPLIIALVDASDNLSIQIHPDDKFAIKNEHLKFGKEESWIFLNAPKSGSIVNGCKVKDRSELNKLIDEKHWDDILDYLEVNENSYVHVSPCTLHALTSGSFVYEIQQSTNITYRFYDYDRVDAIGNKRELHLDKALQVLNLKNKSSAKEAILNKEFDEKTYSILMKEKYYSNISNNSTTFKCYSIIDGSLKYDDITLTKGMSFILFCNSSINIQGFAKLIIATPL